MASSVDKDAFECDVCQNLEHLQFTTTLIELFASASRGCAACKILRNGIQVFVHDEEDYEEVEFVVDLALYAILWKKATRACVTIEFYTHKDSPSIWSAIGYGAHISADSSSDDTIEIAKTWLETCLRSHGECQKELSPLLPTRVIQVPQNGEPARLILSNGRRSKYAALSHRWGGSTAITTTNTNLASRLQSINFEQNSKTFADALEVTRRLGLEYLWIDSLCIIQDSKEDWEDQSTVMHDAYSMATITISAEGAEDASQGLFPDPKVRSSLHKTAVMMAPGLHEKTVVVNLRCHDNHPFWLSRPVHSASRLERSTLQKRGWILQEELLSPRTLRFRKEEMAWTCSTCSLCECKVRPQVPPPNAIRAIFDRLQFSKQVAINDEELEDEEETDSHLQNLYEYWPLVIMDFTRRHLTYSRDRLAAVAGLAAHCEKHTRAQYYCGMWLKDLDFHLLWYVDSRDQSPSDLTSTSDTPYSPSNPTFRFAAPYAPSWSWLSISAPITYHRRLSQIGDSQFSHLQPASIEPFLRTIQCIFSPVRQTNKYGPFHLGIVELISAVIPVTYTASDQSWSVTPPYHIRDYDQRFLHVMPDVPGELTQNADPDEPTRYFFMLCGRWRSGQMMTFLPSQAVCLLVRAPRTPLEIETAESIQGFQDAGWLLKVPPPTTEDMPRAFVRVGMVRGAGSIEAWKECHDAYGFYYLI